MGTPDKILYWTEEEQKILEERALNRIFIASINKEPGEKIYHDIHWKVFETIKEIVEEDRERIARDIFRVDD